MGMTTFLLIISGTVEPRNFNRRMAVSSNEKNAKIGQKGSRGDPLLEFWDPPHISGTVEPRNFKFGTEAGGNQ